MVLVYGYGDLPLGDLIIPCAVLEDGKRLLSETGVVNALGLYRSGALHVRQRDDPDGAQMPLFVAHKNLKPFIDSDLADVLQSPIWYRSAGPGLRHAKGVDATVIPRICDVWLRARDAGVLKSATQIRAAKQADLMMRALANVGIIALIDEATGYQHDRARNALAEILEAFIKDEAGKWAKRFPDDFYRELFRLKNKEWPFEKNPPQYVGHWTNNIIYKRLAPGVMQDLRIRNPREKTGSRKVRHHQWLTDDIGHPKLQEHIQAVLALMRASDTWGQFEKMLNRSLPIQPQTADEKSQKLLSLKD